VSCPWSRGNRAREVTRGQGLLHSIRRVRTRLRRPTWFHRRVAPSSRRADGQKRGIPRLRNHPPDKADWLLISGELLCRPSVLKCRWIFVPVACVLACKQAVAKAPLGALPIRRRRNRLKRSTPCANVPSVSGDHRSGLSDSRRVSAEHKVQSQRNARNAGGKISQKSVI